MKYTAENTCLISINSVPLSEQVILMYLVEKRNYRLQKYKHLIHVASAQQPVLEWMKIGHAYMVSTIDKISQITAKCNDKWKYAWELTDQMALPRPFRLEQYSGELPKTGVLPVTKPRHFLLLHILNQLDSLCSLRLDSPSLPCNAPR